MHEFAIPYRGWIVKKNIIWQNELGVKKSSECIKCQKLLCCLKIQLKIATPE